MRGCWEPRADRALEPGAAQEPSRLGRAGAPRVRDFVPVELRREPTAGATGSPGAAGSSGAPRIDDARATAAATDALEPPAMNAAADRWAGRVTLFGEGDG
jgi:hypothetical protein